MHRLKAIPAGNPFHLSHVYDKAIRARLSRELDFLLPWPEAGEAKTEPGHWPAETEVIFGTWGMPPLLESLLKRVPNLRAIFYGAGSVKPFIDDAVFERGIRVYSGARGNAVPVVEFVLGQILLQLKRFPFLRVKSREDWENLHGMKRHELPGNFRTRVGLVSYGVIARILRERLRAFDHQVLVWDPYLGREEAEEEDVRLVDRETLFRECEAVSVHTPLLPETRGLLGYGEVSAMKEGAILINTARGGVFKQKELARALAERPDLTAVLDVLEKEPPEEDEPLLRLPNAHITPHIAGSMGKECARLGDLMEKACFDFRKGRSSSLEIRREDLARMA